MVNGMIDVEEQKVFCSYEGRINRRAGKRGCPQLALRTFARFLRRVPFGFAAFARTGALEDDVIHLEAALNLLSDYLKELFWRIFLLSISGLSRSVSALLFHHLFSLELAMLVK